MFVPKNDEETKRLLQSLYPILVHFTDTHFCEEDCCAGYSDEDMIKKYLKLYHYIIDRWYSEEE